MKKFPHLVQMHKTYAVDGLVCLSLNNQDIEKPERDRALKFLQEQGASFANFLLVDSDENEKKYSDRYPTNVTPLVMIFNRKGNRVQAYDDPKAEVIEAEVRKLLAEK